MMKTYFQHLSNAIKTMHYRYGVGDIQEIKQFGNGKVEIIAKGYGMKPHKRRGHVTGENFGKRTIKLYGHQMTVHIV
jgi:hypothetical protein